jgi:hypothetical protein
MINTISFESNNQSKLELKQRNHDGKVLIHGVDDVLPDSIAFISPGDFTMLINYYINCKRGLEKSDYIKPSNQI